MQIRKFTLHAGDDGTQEEELNKFLRAHRILTIEHHYDERLSAWSLLISFQDASQSSSDVARRNEKPDPEKELTETQYGRYKQYAERRSELAKRDGVKAFHIFTNIELMKIAKLDAPDLKQIAEINGIGEKRATQYGNDILSPIPMGNEIEPTTDETGREPDGESLPY